MSKRKKFVIVITSVLLVIVLAVLAVIVWPYVQGWNNSSEVFQYVEMPEDEETLEQESSSKEAPVEFPVIDWDGLLATNSDIIAWVYVPGTRVNYAIVQASKDNPQYYLSHDLQGNYNVYGVPYLDWEMKTLGSFNARFCLVYGHHMINGTMFSDMAKMSSEQYALEHQQILLMTPEENMVLTVQAVNIVNANKEDIQVIFPTVENLREYMTEKISQSELVLNAQALQETDRVYCFVTCSYNTTNERTLVYED
jgi:sortase B